MTKVGKKYTVADLKTEAYKMLREEMQGIKNRPLNKNEEIKMKELGSLLSKSVLKDMKLI